jgi:hypothetical protein
MARRHDHGVICTYLRHWIMLHEKVANPSCLFLGQAVVENLDVAFKLFSSYLRLACEA